MALEGDSKRLVVCPKCGGSYPAAYAGCPRCSELEDERRSAAGIVLLVLVALVALYTVAKLTGILATLTPYL